MISFVAPATVAFACVVVSSGQLFKDQLRSWTGPVHGVTISIESFVVFTTCFRQVIAVQGSL